MTRGFLLALDQGTTGSRALIYDRNAKVIGSAYQEFPQYYPKPGWVEHNPEEIWNSVSRVIQQSLRAARLKFSDIKIIGITNQRETVVVWDKKTGKPFYNAIVWQDRRTSAYCDALKKRGLEKKIRAKTGLVLDPYFSATKIHWLLEHIPGLKTKSAQGRVLCGTIDSWLLWKLTNGAVHATDFTNASRTLLFNIRSRQWDKELLRLFKIPASMLPEVKSSGGNFGRTRMRKLSGNAEIFSMIGDQQAALYGQSCYNAGESKNTYGTGCFLLMNLGKNYKQPPSGLLTTLACDRDGKSVYAFEGSVFIAGAAIQWLRDGLKFFTKAAETETLIKEVSDTGGVVFIPAFAGLGAPYWRPHARGMISGLTRGTKKAHIIRAALESIAQQTADILEVMQQGSRHKLKNLKVDGGATRNRFLMQFQADLLRIPVQVSEISESTAWGAAKLAAHASGFWNTRQESQKYRVNRPKLASSEALVLRKTWKREMTRLLTDF